MAPDPEDVLERGRRAYASEAWADACAALATADSVAPLAPADLERFAFAAYLTGRDADSEALLARAHHDYLQQNEPEAAARCAFWQAFALLNRGEQARGGGWLARAQRVLDDAALDCVVRGYLHLPAALRCTGAGEFQAAYDHFTHAVAYAERFHDADLGALGRQGQGRARIRLGDAAGGVALLDDAMVAVEAGEVSPIVTGTVYCSVVDACTEILDVQRAREWTASLSRWCEARPDLVPFRGQCLVRRAEILQLRGAWQEALVEARHAHARLSEPPPPQAAAGLALVQQADVHRLRGEFAQAEAAYREAARWTRRPQAGVALLLLAQNDVAAAAAAIRALLADARDIRSRATLLAASVEINLASGDVAAARTAADELTAIGNDIDAALLHALAAHARGAVLLAENDAQAARTTLQHAWQAWQSLDVPYEAARVRVLIAQADLRLGDRATAAIELDAARWAFQQLGAAPDVARTDRLLQHAQRSTARTDSGAAGLTSRELEVLRLVAKGGTNRSIATSLFISEKTVHRHVSNIFRKIGVSTRAAAAAYAFEHGLVASS